MTDAFISGNIKVLVVTPTPVCNKNEHIPELNKQKCGYTAAGQFNYA